MSSSRRSQRFHDQKDSSEQTPITSSSSDDEYYYERWIPRYARRNPVVRPLRKRPHEPGVVTCYEANVANVKDSAELLTPPSGSSTAVTMCSRCGNYANDRKLRKHLSLAVDQYDTNVGVRYQCETLWVKLRTDPADSPSNSNKRSKVADRPSSSQPLSNAESPPPSPLANPCQQLSLQVQEEPPDFTSSSLTVTNTVKVGGSSHWKVQQKDNVAINYKLREENCLLQQAIIGAASHAQKTANEIQVVVESKLKSTLNDLTASHEAAIKTLKSEHEAERKKNVTAITELKELHRLEVTHIEEVHKEEVSKLRSVIARMKQTFADKEKERQSSQRADDNARRQLEKEFVEVPKSEEDLAATIEQLVEKTFSNKRMRNSTKMKKLVEAVWEHTYGGQCQKELVQKALPIIRKSNPYRKTEEILRVLDMNGIKMNMSALDELRRGIEGGDGEGTKRGESWMASQHYLKKTMKQLEDAAETIIPYEMLETEDGIDGIKFHMAKMFRYLLRLYQLEDIARDSTQPRVEYALTLDGSDLSRNCSHVTCGSKMVDPRAIDPVTGLPLGMPGSRKIQSRENCFVFKIILSRDTKSLYDEHFADFFAFFQDIVENGFEDDIGPDRFAFSSPQDMSSFWKCLKKGGACKQAKTFCHCCSCKSDDCCKPNVERCARCVESGREICYHHDVGDRETVARYQECLDALKENYAYLSDPKIKEKLLLHVSPDEVNKTNDWSNVDFKPKTTEDAVRFGNQFVNHDLQVLGLPRRGNLDERRRRLRAALLIIEQSSTLEAGVEAGDYSDAHILIEQAIPCILHCENRCGEKIVKLLLVEGLLNCGGDTASEETMLKAFEHTVNTRVLGHPWRKANWRLATQRDKDHKKMIADQTMPNQHVRKFIENFDHLIEICVTDESRKEKWANTIELWLLVTERARHREDFTDDDIEEFQDICDDFYQGWIELHGRAGITNYFHMVGAGHLSYYLRVWRNLYRYSQQGWESLNSLIKQYYYHRTQRGGHGGKRDQRNSKVKPIARWLQRKLLFLSGDYKDILA